jgi:hypothetical protein
LTKKETLLKGILLTVLRLKKNQMTVIPQKEVINFKVGEREFHSKVCKLSNNQ